MADSQTASKPMPLSSEQQEMLVQIRQVDVEQQRGFASVQLKLSFFFLIASVVLSFVLGKDNSPLVLVSMGAVAFIFFLMSRSKQGSCDLLELIQQLDRQQASGDSTDSNS